MFMFVFNHSYTYTLEYVFWDNILELLNKSILYCIALYYSVKE